MSKKEFSVDSNDERINPTMLFLSKEQSAEIPEAAEPTPGEQSATSCTQGFSFKSVTDKEKRDRRVILMVTQTMYKRLKAKAEETGQSMNEIIIQSLDFTLKENTDE